MRVAELDHKCVETWFYGRLAARSPCAASHPHVLAGFSQTACCQRWQVLKLHAPLSLSRAL
jgi:hypothetical protein